MITRDDVQSMQPGPELDALVAKEVFGERELSVEEAVEKFTESCAHIFHTDGAYVDRQNDLVFDKKEHDNRFSRIRYEPEWKEWLLQNSRVRHKPAKPYSTDVSAALMAAERVKEMGFWICISLDGSSCLSGFLVEVGRECRILDGARCDEAAEAIVKAILPLVM